VKRIIAPVVLTSLLLAQIIPVFVFAQQHSPASTSSDGPASRTTRREMRPVGPIADITRDFNEALSVVQQQYVDGQKLNYNDVFKSSIIGMLRSLDPHSNYYDREEYDELKTDQRSEYTGIGASIQTYLYQGQADTYITATFDKSPAARAGLRFGDRIVEVDGVKMAGRGSLEVRDKIRGPRGSQVVITIERASDKRLAKVEITRDVVPQPSIPDAYLLKPGVGYIDMTRGFNYTTTDELLDALEVLHSKGMQSLVLDLRNNPGGFFDQAIHVAEVFLKNGQLILTQKGRDGLRDNTYESRNYKPDLVPLVILINENTASASEIVAGAMQDHDRALIVGQTSFGKGLVQSIIPLEGGGGLTLTSAKYYTPSGRLIQRDYTHGGFYDYYTRGGLTHDNEKLAVKTTDQEKKTDTGRAVYGGGGIMPDEDVKPRTLNVTQRRLLTPTFLFTRELVNGRLKGFESSRVVTPIAAAKDPQIDSIRISDPLFKAFKDFALADPAFNVTAAQIDRYRPFLELELRFHLATVVYGRVIADRVFVLADDPQVSKAMDILPKARDLSAGRTSSSTQP
jgi:carboxyl-terminal processing protease